MKAYKNSEAQVSNRDLTLLEWPRAIRAAAEIPLSFSAAANQWLGNNFDDTLMVYVPKESLNRRSSAWLLACRAGCFLLLKETKKAVQSFTFSAQDIGCLEQTRIMLESYLAFTYRSETGNWQTVSMPYNRAVEELFLPFLNAALCQSYPCDYSAAERMHPRPRTILQDHMALYNYALDGYRLGMPRGPMDAFDVLPEWHRLGFARRREEALACQFDNGSFAIRFFPKNQEIHEYFWPASQSSADRRESPTLTWRFYVDGEAAPRMTLSAAEDSKRSR